MSPRAPNWAKWVNPRWYTRQIEWTKWTFIGLMVGTLFVCGVVTADCLLADGVLNGYYGTTSSDKVTAGAILTGIYGTIGVFLLWWTIRENRKHD